MRINSSPSRLPLRQLAEATFKFGKPLADKDVPLDGWLGDEHEEED